MYLKFSILFLFYLIFRYLSTGNDYQSLSYLFRVSPSSISIIVREVCQLIIDILSPMYLRTPETETEWLNVSREFGQEVNFKQCLGSIDCKHIRITKPKNSGSVFFNRKKFFSIQLLAIVDAEYRIRYLDVGKEGSRADVTVWNECSFKKKLDQGKLNIPRSNLDDLPYVFVGDGGFELTNNFMVPYRQKSLINSMRKVYNFRLTRARRLVEQVFGILANRFRVLFRPMNVSPHTAKKITAAICVLHNLLIDRNPANYLRGNHLNNHLVQDSDTSSEEDSPNLIRDRFAYNFYHIDIVDYQYNIL